MPKFTEQDRIAKSVSGRYNWAVGPGVDREDLEQEARLALFLKGKETGVDAYSEAARAALKYARRNCRSVTMPADKREVMGSDVRHFMRRDQYPMSQGLERERGSDKGDGHHDSFDRIALAQEAEQPEGAEDAAAVSERRALVRKAITACQARGDITAAQARSVRLHVMHDVTLRDIADNEGVSYEGVRLWILKALEVLQAEFKRIGLDGRC